MSVMNPQRVVVPVDFSDQSFAAVDQAVEIAGSADKVDVVHVLPDLSPVEPGVVWQTIDDASRANQTKEAIVERLAGDKYQGIGIHTLFGDPGGEISKHAETVKADLVVLPSHGRTGLSRLLIGSVAERVVRLAHCPVLVMRN